jgi:hypothetical protein
VFLLLGPSFDVPNATVSPPPPPHPVRPRAALSISA